MASKNNENFKQGVYDLLVNHDFNDIKLLNQTGEEVPVPQEADAIQFSYKHDDHDLGTVTLTIDNRTVTVYFNQSLTSDEDDTSNWTDFLKKLRSFAQRKGQLGFKIDNLDKLDSHMKQRAHTEAKAQLGESYYGNRTTSYSDDVPTIKMIIKHNKALSETDARFRYIERIFLENGAGERLLVPSTKPSVGRVFATHLREGGEYRDGRWNHLAQISEDISKLGGFLRATRTKQFNEGVQGAVSAAEEHYHTLRESIKRMQTSRGYNSYFESWQPTLLEDASDYDYGNAFGDSSDPRISAALPVLGRLNIRLDEMSETNEFESWANDLVHEALKPHNNAQEQKIIDLVGPESEEMPVGPDAVNAIGELDGIIEDDNLYDRLRKVAAGDPDMDARPVIVAWMAENNKDSYADILDKLKTTPETPVASAEPPAPPEDQGTDELPMPDLPEPGTDLPPGGEEMPGGNELPPPEGEELPPEGELPTDDEAPQNDLEIPELPEPTTSKGKKQPSLAENDMLARIRKLSGLR
jgi:hypothetical protein